MLEAVESVTIDEADSIEALESIRDEWHSLWLESAGATPFQSPQWLIPWWRHLGKGELFVLALRSGARLAGLAPFFISAPEAETGRQAAFIGTGISDYLDILCEPQKEHACTNAVLGYLSKNRSRWDKCDLQELSPLSAVLGAVPHEGLIMEAAPQSVCPYVELPASEEEFYKGLPAAFRIRVRRSWRALNKAGAVKIELADRDSLPDFLDALFTLHNARWKAAGSRGVLSENAVQAFHREAARGLLDSENLLFWRLSLDSRAAAVIYAFVKDRRVYAYLGGFDPELEKLSPGRVLMACSMADSINRGMKEYDMMRGSERYKYAWGARDRLNYRLTISPEDAGR